ncbi:MAG: hypothetical protein ACMUIL_05620 [bacterium]
MLVHTGIARKTSMARRRSGRTGMARRAIPYVQMHHLNPEGNGLSGDSGAVSRGSKGIGDGRGCEGGMALL